MNWYARYPGDYMRDTAHLTLAEHGVYALLLDHYYSTGGPLPNSADALIRICRAYEDVEKVAVESVADQYFPVNGDGKRHNKRADAELIKAGDKSEKARRSAAVRWDSEGNANAMRTHKRTQCSPPPHPHPHPDTTNHKPKKGIAPVKPVASKPRERNLEMDALGCIEGDLADLNQAAWKRVAKALKDIREVAPEVTPEEIAKRASNYRQHFDGAACTATALAKHWARCKKEPEQQGIGYKRNDTGYVPPKEYAT